MPMHKTTLTTAADNATDRARRFAKTENGASFWCRRSRSGRSFIGISVSGKLSYLARLTQHLVDFAQVRFFLSNHVPRIFFEQHGPIFHEFQQAIVKRQAFLLGFKGLEQDVVDTVLVGLE